MVRFAVIGGSSLVTFDAKGAFSPLGLSAAAPEIIKIENKFGAVAVKKFELSRADGKIAHTLFFMQRHSHEGEHGIQTSITPPHMINYRANVRALNDLGVDFVVATTSVGTMVPCFPPGRVGVARQYIDFTGAATTFFHEDAKFTSMTQPFDVTLNAELTATLKRAQKLDDKTQLGFVIWLSTGPHYETEAEVNAIERLGGECCGMTAAREAKLCAELDLPYAALAIASNWAAGRCPGDPTRALCHEEVSETSKTTTGIIIECLVDLLRNRESSATTNAKH